MKPRSVPDRTRPSSSPYWAPRTRFIRMLFDRVSTDSEPALGVLVVAQLPAGVADQHHGAVLLEQAGDALVVVHAAVDELDVDRRRRGRGA